MTHDQRASQPRWRRILGSALVVDLVLLVAIACGIRAGVLRIGDTDRWTERAQSPIAIPSAVLVEAMLCAAGVAVLLGGGLLLATTVHFLWRGVRHTWSIRSVRFSPCPELRAAAAGLVPRSRLFQLLDERPYAVCVGLWQPAVYVSQGLINRLSPDALRAALAHEEAHRRRRDPLRLLLLRVVNRGMLFAWCPVDMLSSAELRAEVTADRFARVYVSTAALADALLAVLRPYAGGQPFQDGTVGARAFPLRLDGPSRLDAIRLLDERLRYLTLPLDAALPHLAPTHPAGHSRSIGLRQVVWGLARSMAPMLVITAGGAVLLALLVLTALPVAISCPLAV